MSDRESADYTVDSYSEGSGAWGALDDLEAELALEVAETSKALRRSSAKHAFDATGVVATGSTAIVAALREALRLEVFHATDAESAILAASAPFVRLVVLDLALPDAPLVIAALVGGVPVIALGTDAERGAGAAAVVPDVAGVREAYERLVPPETRRSLH